MTTDEILLVTKQFIGEAVATVGGEDPQYMDTTLFEYLRTAQLLIESHGIVTGVTISITSETISPDASDAIGMLLATGAASLLVSDEMMRDLRAGTLGISFSTPISTISTNQAAITLQNFGTGLKGRFERLMTLYLATDPDSVIQRAQ